MGRPSSTPDLRVWKYVPSWLPEDRCWPWQGAASTRVGGNRGVLNLPGSRKQILATRVIFEDLHGYLPKVVRHSCDNPICVNPGHLLPGTQLENTRDSIERGRHVDPPVHHRGRHKQDCPMDGTCSCY
jgi:hypothetical protein